MHKFSKEILFLHYDMRKYMINDCRHIYISKSFIIYLPYPFPFPYNFFSLHFSFVFVFFILFEKKLFFCWLCIFFYSNVYLWICLFFFCSSLLILFLFLSLSLFISILCCHIIKWIWKGVFILKNHLSLFWTFHCLDFFFVLL